VSGVRASAEVRSGVAVQRRVIGRVSRRPGSVSEVRGIAAQPGRLGGSAWSAAVPLGVLSLDFRFGCGTLPIGSVVAP
jgi:hypothetical protein